MAKQKKPLFAAIPLQVIGHRALSAAHFQVLTAIAWHDQFGANGIGCYASLKTLARETGLAQTTVSECTGQLEAFGLLAKSRHPLNRRTKVYSLIYKGNPAIVPETRNCPTDHGAAGTKLPESGNDPGATLRVENREVPETVEQTGSKYITRSVREKIEESGRQGKSSNSARAREAARSPAVPFEDFDRPHFLDRNNPENLTDVGNHVLVLCGVQPEAWLHDFHVIASWLQAGADPKQDIYPTVKRLVDDNPNFTPPRSARGLSYFTEAVVEARSKRLERPNGSDPDFDPERSRWEGRVSGYVKRSFWIPEWGPKPGYPGCQAPHDILEEYGIATQA